MTSMVLSQDQDYEVGQGMAVATIGEAHARMAALDEEQILGACQGAVIKQWQYTFTVGGKEVSGISITGAMEIARIRAESGRPIRWTNVLADPATQDGVDGLRVTVHARDQRSGAETVAMVFEPWRDPKGRPNPFVERKALSKAKRNCVLDLIPETQILELLKIAKDFAEGRVPRQPKEQRQVSAAPKREVSPRVVESVPAVEGNPVQMVGGPNPYNLTTPETMREIAILVEHPANLKAKEGVAKRIERGKFNDANVAQTAVEALKLGIRDAGADPEAWLKEHAA